MRDLSKTSQALMAWIDETRQHAPLLDDDADALLLRLTAAAAHESVLARAASQPRTVGLYGHAQAAKAHLLTALCSSGSGRVNVRAGEKSFDYLSHINPGHALTGMALRFTTQIQNVDDAFPLRLRLMSEAELVQVFIAHAAGEQERHLVDRAVVEDRLNRWRGLRQPHPVAGITAEEVGAIAAFWRTTVPAAQQQIDDGLWYQLATLIPALDLRARASAWSLLWGEQQELTQQWLALAHVLHQTGNAAELAAPLSLLVDNFALPTEGFLNPLAAESIEAQAEVVVHPLSKDELQNAVSIPLATLSLLTYELVLCVEDTVLDGVDIVDIPCPAAQPQRPLWHSKCRWLLEHYRQQLQPDVLMICNATPQRSATAVTARGLLNWVQETQSGQETALPGLVWAITPQDARFTTSLNLDETVQQLLGKPGQRWGTLQALDASSLQRLIEWLSQATTPSLRTSRLTALRERHYQTLRDLMQPLLSPLTEDADTRRTRAESAIRELQGQAGRHGELLEGLLPEMKQFDALWKVQLPREEKVSGLFNEAIDLFADAQETPERASAARDAGQQAHAMWVNHLRQWSRSAESAVRLDITPATLRQVADTIITTSYRLDLASQLQTLMQRDNACAAQLHAAIGNLIAWLGYADVAVDQRPASRIQKGSAIFSTDAPAHTEGRLTRLGDQPVHAATRYVYDWLVALYTRSTENIGYRHPSDVTDAQRKTLLTLLP